MMKMNGSFAEKTVRLGCIASGVGAGCGLTLFATCAAVGVAETAKGAPGIWSAIISLCVIAVVVTLVYLLVRKSMELRLLRDEMKPKDEPPQAGGASGPK